MNHILSNAKKVTLTDTYCPIEKIRWIFADSTDERVKKAALRMTESQDNGTPVHVSHAPGTGEGYTLAIKEGEITVTGTGAAGAFYGLMTLGSMLSDGCVPCGTVEDAPDMAYRGFYQDTTRGRVPRLATLKKLADTMAAYKLNSLQLYVEHSFEFKEYASVRDQLGYLTADEIRDLDAYCKERFIDLVPSLSCFGHLYHLLQIDEYKHLCEVKDFQPHFHHWLERMSHHTINPLLDESFALITSLIDQHMAAFTSDYFNICCDETFDLGTNVNQDKDKGELYVGFVKKLAEYIRFKGKTPMMWADVALHHADRLSELPADIILLNWAYDPHPGEDSFIRLADKNHIACPGTSSWYGFSERPCVEESNILTMAAHGYKYGARGLLNTNWGDLGNPASVDMAMYGLALGAMISWNKNFTLNDTVKAQISAHLYGNAEAIKFLDMFGEISPVSNWSGYLYNSTEELTEANFTEAMARCEDALVELNGMDFTVSGMKEAFILATQGYMQIIRWYAKKRGFVVPCSVDYAAWFVDFKRMWLVESKPSELDLIEKTFLINEAAALCEIPVYTSIYGDGQRMF